MSPSSLLSQRIFPSTTPTLYSGSSCDPGAEPGARLACAFLALAQRELTWRQRLLRSGLDAAGRIGRLLALHKAACEAEAEGIWGRADFFWREHHNELASLWDRLPVWEEAVAAVARKAEIGFESSAAELRDRLLDEVFLDTHHAFYLGLSQGVESPSPSDRAFFHVEAIEKLLDRSARSTDEKRSVYGPLFIARIAACQETDRWDQAVTFAARLVALFPGDRESLELLVYSEHTRTMKSLRPGSGFELANAQALQGGIERQEALRRAHPSSASLFESLATLHHLRAVKLANGNRVAEALVEVERSLAFRPGEEEVEKARVQLIEMMQALQKQMRAVEASLATRPNAHLSIEGMALREQARQGLQPAQKFRESSEANQILQTRAVAQVRTLWLRVGLPVPVEGWDEGAFALAKALDQIASHPPRKASGIAAAWHRMAAEDPFLTSLDATRIETFLRRHLLDEKEEEATPAFPAPAPLAVRSRERRPGGEPLVEWIFSRQNPWIKAQAVLAVVLLLVAGALTLRETRNRHARDLAWSGLQEASRSRDDLGVIKSSEAFFATAPPPGGDPLREAQARSLYSQALVRWFVQSPGEPSVEALQHAKQYSTFLASHPEEALQ